MPHKYDDEFMSYADISSKMSANIIIKLLSSSITVRSVLDIGCAKGTWLKAWHASGATDILGVDGHYVIKGNLVIPQVAFQARDVATEMDLGQKFDLVQSLEVAEHIEECNADIFVGNLVHHSKGYILFSAAPPGQGGEHHVNEQPYEYWRQKFQLKGYEAYDYIRPNVANNKEVSYWYKFNTILYIHESAAQALPPTVLSTRVPRDAVIKDFSPFIFRLRKYIVNLLPKSFQNLLAHLKASYFPSGRV